MNPTNPSHVCQHCLASPASRPRGLCWCCYYAPGVREQYAPVGKCGLRGVGHTGAALDTPAPTTASPGSPAKVAELARRVALGQSLWHPQDQPFDEMSMRLLAEQHAQLDPEARRRMSARSLAG
jgi:hypothetical protein